MKIYIRSTACISPQETFGQESFLTHPLGYTRNFLKVIEPDYESVLEPRLIRRMSRIIKMGVAAALECLRKGGITNPGAIVTGTAYGCLEDSGIFLRQVIQQGEKMLSPTAFIQSTHNTVGAQIALVLKCNEYNNTFVHRGFSFESALLDGTMLLEEKETKNVLVGGVDEMTDTSFAILDRFGLYKSAPVNNLSLYSSRSPGTIGGEGAAFFLLSSEPSRDDNVQLEGCNTFYKPTSIENIVKNISDFYAAYSLRGDEIDLVIAGRNGDISNDQVYDDLQERIFTANKVINYKCLCGEYPTAVSFAMWLAAKILQGGHVPGIFRYQGNKQIKRVLIYNNYLGIYHSLILLSAVK